MLLTAIWNVLSKLEPYDPSGYLLHVPLSIRRKFLLKKVCVSRKRTAFPSKSSLLLSFPFSYDGGVSNLTLFSLLFIKCLRVLVQTISSRWNFRLFRAAQTAASKNLFFLNNIAESDIATSIEFSVLCSTIQI